MRKNSRKNLYAAISMLVAFVLWTFLIGFVDVQPIGPEKTSVGLAAVNGFLHRLTGVHFTLYHITDWLGLIPLGFVAGFAGLGLAQWIRRKHIKNIDYNLLVLGGFYIVVMAVYVLFERIVINYRPVLIDGILEASYPSSTTTLVLCVMPTAIMQFHERIQNHIFKCCLVSIMTVFIMFMVIGRLISGVHWFTDIVGGALLSTGLVMLYRYISRLNASKNTRSKKE